MVAVNHPLAECMTVEAVELVSLRLLSLDTGHRLSRIVYALAAEGAIVSNDCEGTGLDSILLMAAAGAEVAVITDLFARRQALRREEGTLRPLRMPNAHRTISLLFPEVSEA